LQPLPSAHTNRTPFVLLITILLVSLVQTGPAIGGEGKAKVGQAPPELEWLSVSGDTLSWDDVRGEGSLLITFWATWCTACKKDLPKLQDLYLSYAETGDLAFATISLGEKAGQVAKVIEAREMEGIALIDPKEKNANALGVEYVPTVWILDSQGKLVYAGLPKLKTIGKHLEDITTPVPEEQP
jgi:cytochrome c biogenesis protein CcmG/thiol:disulfide interchange protein DsbE